MASVQVYPLTSKLSTVWTQTLGVESSRGAYKRLIVILFSDLVILYRSEIMQLK